MDILKEISESVQFDDNEKVRGLIRNAIEGKIPPEDILDKGLIHGMDKIGEKYKIHEIFLPDVLLAAKAMYVGMNLLKSIFVKEGIPTIGKVVLGSVQGDSHDIGKNPVGIMLRGVGFEAIDLGTNVTP